MREIAFESHGSHRARRHRLVPLLGRVGCALEASIGHPLARAQAADRREPWHRRRIVGHVIVAARPAATRTWLVRGQALIAVGVATREPSVAMERPRPLASITRDLAPVTRDAPLIGEGR
jgi:hypothetical protein